MLNLFGYEISRQIGLVNGGNILPKTPNKTLGRRIAQTKGNEEVKAMDYRYFPE